MEIALILKVENYFNMHNSLLGKKKNPIIFVKEKIKTNKKK